MPPDPLWRRLFDGWLIAFFALAILYGAIQLVRGVWLGTHCQGAVVYDALGRPVCVAPDRVWINQGNRQ